MTWTEDVRQQVGDRVVVAGEVVKRRTHIACQPVEHGGEQGGLGAEVLEDHRLGHPDPGGHVGHLPRAVAAGGEHLGRGVQDRLPPLPGGQPGTPPLHSRPLPVSRGKPGLVATKHRAANSHAGNAHANRGI